jgi:hypothetical protein
LLIQYHDLFNTIRSHFQIPYFLKRTLLAIAGYKVAQIGKRDYSDGKPGKQNKNGTEGDINAYPGKPYGNDFLESIVIHYDHPVAVALSFECGFFIPVQHPKKVGIKV